MAGKLPDMEAIFFAARHIIPAAMPIYLSEKQLRWLQVRRRFCSTDK
jgi:hypothetical protein